MNIPDNYDQWLSNEQEKEKRLAERPECDHCHHNIQADHLYRINGEAICPECLENYFREEIE